MRLLVLIALFALGQAAFAKAPPQSRALEDTIKNFLECLRGEMIDGWPDYGVPSLNPLQIVNSTIDFDSLNIDGTIGYINVQNFIVSGLTDFIYDKVKGTINLVPPGYTIGLEIILPKIILDTEYHGDVRNDNLAFFTYGNGELYMDANDLKAGIGFNIQILGEISLKYLEVWLTMSPFSAFKVTGIRNDEAYSAEISADLLTNGHYYLTQFSMVIRYMIEVIANELIAGGILDDGGFISGIIDRCL